MPQFVEKATTYGYGKAGPYLDTACEKVPLVQSVVKLVVPYAKPSIQFADKIVDKTLDLTSKPVEIARSTISSISAKASNFKAAITTRVSASKTAEKFKALVVEKRSLVLKVVEKRFQEQKALVAAKLEEAVSWVKAKLLTLVTKLRLTELKDMASKKGSEVKTLAIDTKNMAYSKGSAGKAYVVDVFHMVSGKAYTAATRVAGKVRVDSVIEQVGKYAPTKEMAKKEQ